MSHRFSLGTPRPRHRQHNSCPGGSLEPVSQLPPHQRTQGYGVRLLRHPASPAHQVAPVQEPRCPPASTMTQRLSAELCGSSLPRASRCSSDGATPLLYPTPPTIGNLKPPSATSHPTDTHPPQGANIHQTIHPAHTGKGLAPESIRPPKTTGSRTPKPKLVTDANEVLCRILELETLCIGTEPVLRYSEVLAAFAAR